MNELSPYLRNLLREHKCAIIPDFGGFVMQHHGANHDSATSQFAPPSETVGFNALLLAEDGLLAQEVRKDRGLSYASAADFVQECVRAMKRDLRMGEIVTLDGVGHLHLAGDGKINFTPEQDERLSPENYFLRSLHLPILPEADVTGAENPTVFVAGPQQDRVPETPEIAVPSPSSSSVHTRPPVSRRAYQAYVAMFVVTLCFFWAIPLNRRSTNPGKTADATMFAQLPQMKVVGEVLSSLSGTEDAKPVSRPGAEALLETYQNDSAKKGKDDGVVEKTTGEETAATEIKAKTAALSSASFALVLASQTTREGASRLVDQLRSAGFESARSVMGRHGARVLVGHYTSRAEAQEAKRTALSKHAAFSESWITAE